MDFAGISGMQLREQITDKQIKTLQIITLAFAAGVVFMTIFVWYLYQAHHVDEIFREPNVLIKNTKIMLLVVILIAFTQYMMAFVIVKSLLSKQRLKTLLQNSSIYFKTALNNGPVTLLFNVYRQMLIMRLAIFEGVALAGLVILVTAILNGGIKLYPPVWLALVPVVIFTIFVYLYYPTKEKAIFFLENNGSMLI